MANDAEIHSRLQQQLREKVSVDLTLHFFDCKTCSNS